MSSRYTSNIHRRCSWHREGITCPKKNNAFPSFLLSPVCPQQPPAAKVPTGSDLGQALQLRGGSMDRFNVPGNFMWGLKPGRWGLHWLLEVAGSWLVSGWDFWKSMKKDGKKEGKNGCKELMDGSDFLRIGSTLDPPARIKLNVSEPFLWAVQSWPSNTPFHTSQCHRGQWPRCPSRECLDTASFSGACE